ncbi:MAG: PepSY domain-containing protein [Rickettsiales bacterium]|nr:PepSY domain-containing protein [Rickettsiales bacterium]
MAAKPLYYNFFWRWHFYAGLIVTPIILIMAMTGGVYLLQPQIENWLYGNRFYLHEAYHGAVNHDAIIKAAKTSLDAKQLHSYQPPFAADQSAQIVLSTQSGEKLTAFLHPGTHTLLGTVGEKWRLMNVARETHKNLLLGTTGRVVTELAACWLIVMIATGFYLWWPRGNKERGTIIPNIKSNGRNLWREFHAVPGAWTGLWILALLITGLPWSMVWGGLLSDISTRAGEGFPKAVFAARPMSQSDDILPEISINTLFEAIAYKDVKHAFKIEYPRGPKGSYALMPLRHGGDSENIAYLFFDRRSGVVLDEYRFDDLGKVGRLTALGVAFHEGRLFGSANQILNLTAVLALISMCITGPVMWWKRKPQRALGAPRLPDNVKLPKRLIALIALVGIVLPLFGASVLVIWLGETLITKVKRHATC